MTDEERNSLFYQMHEFSRHKKDVILTRTFGAMEAAQAENEPYDINRFFTLVQHLVDREAESK